MISAYMLNASGELTTGDIAGIMGTIEPDSYGRRTALRAHIIIMMKPVRILLMSLVVLMPNI